MFEFIVKSFHHKICFQMGLQDYKAGNLERKTDKYVNRREAGKIKYSPTRNYIGKQTHTDTLTDRRTHIKMNNTMPFKLKTANGRKNVHNLKTYRIKQS